MMMTNEEKIQNTNEASEFENFERLAKKLINLKPIDISKIEEEEKAMGIAPDESDLELNSEEED